MNFTMPWTATNGHTNGTTDKLEDVRHALGREVDHLAQVAAQVGRDASTHAEDVAHDVARDAQKGTNVAINRIADIAATLGPTIAAVGRQRMRQVGEQAQTLGNELRQVRITTEPRRNGLGLRSGVALIGGLGIGLGIGIAAMYLFDPEHGVLRRKVLMARLAQKTREGRAVAAEKAGAFAERTVAVMSDVRETVTNGISGPDEPLIAEELSYEKWPEGTRVPTA